MSPQCRFCHAPLDQSVIDLGHTPLANSYLPMNDPNAIAKERRFALHVMVCTQCWLVQTTETVPADAIFDHGYAYLSSFSTGWVAHAKRFADEMVARFSLPKSARIVEIASNDGYLLQHFKKMGFGTLGIEPAGHAAELARAKGIETRIAFFGEDQARALRTEGVLADLMVANNVLAHVPDIADFIRGFSTLLAPHGVASFEFPHLAELLKHAQFDTIYHEHYAYLSLGFVERLMSKAGLEVFDVIPLPTHGGSLRVLVGHRGAHAVQPGRAKTRATETEMQLERPKSYAALAQHTAQIVADFHRFVKSAKQAKKTIAGYGAAAKGNTFLNTAQAGSHDLAFVVDRNPEKQNHLLPGSHIPVYAPAAIAQHKPDYLIILPWNLADEVMAQQAQIRDWGGQFVTFIPKLQIR
jgi:2-polyprenyl-3-methyl-5-hydroxy-6-metoxy-1,4-benzoquinol methylase